MNQVDWLAFYILVGFTGGILFFILDPLRTQSFKWKGVVNIGGAAAIGAGFMFLASTLTPTQTSATLDSLMEAGRNLEGRIRNEFGDSMTIRVSAAQLVIDVSNYSLRGEQGIRSRLQALSSPTIEPRIVFHPPSFRVVVMDSWLPELIYKPEIGSNAAVLLPLLKDLRELRFSTERTDPGWDLHQQVFENNPDLIVIHASCFLRHTRQPPALASLDQDPFNAFLKYIAPTKAKFLVYSRVLYASSEEDEGKRLEALEPRLKDRVKFFYAKDHFKTGPELTRFKQTVKDILQLP
jgi:hypothetical protein